MLSPCKQDKNRIYQEPHFQIFQDVNYLIGIIHSTGIRGRDKMSHSYFQETNVKYVHYTGAFMCFGFGTVYFWIQVCLCFASHISKPMVRIFVYGFNNKQRNKLCYKKRPMLALLSFSPRYWEWMLLLMCRQQYMLWNSVGFMESTKMHLTNLSFQNMANFIETIFFKLIKKINTCIILMKIFKKCI